MKHFQVGHDIIISDAVSGGWEIPATNNTPERETRPSVMVRKVTNSFKSNWGARIHAG